MKAKSILSGLKSAFVPILLLLGMILNFNAFMNSRSKLSAALDAYNARLERYESSINEFRSLVSSIPPSFTNPVSVVSALSSPSSFSPTNSLPSVRPSRTIRYHYMVVNGFPAIRYYGRHFSIGSPFGSMDTRIAEIFPDVLRLSDGTELYNSFNPDVDGSYFHSSQPSTSTASLKEVHKNDAS